MSFRKSNTRLSHAFLTYDDLILFCSQMGYIFSQLGSPVDWSDSTVFQVCMKDKPLSYKTISMEKVVEWKKVADTINIVIMPNTKYKHFKGDIYTLLFTATDAVTGITDIVYQCEDEVNHTRPIDNFFSVVEYDGKMVPRYTYIPN